MPDAIELVAPEVRVRSPGAGIRFAESTMEIRAKLAATLDAGAVTLQSEGARLTLNASVSIEAPQIDLASGAPARSDGPDGDETATQIELFDPLGKPLANQHYVVVTKEGARIGGMVGADGKDTVYLKEGNAIEFPDLGALEALG
jgi:hypothetical protein